MDLYKLLGFVQILRESIQILSKNGRLMAFIATLFFLLYSLFYLLNIFSIYPLISDLVFKIMDLPSTSPSSPKFFALLLAIQKDSGLFLGVEIIFYLAYFVVSLISITATIFVSSSYYNGETFSFKEVLLKAIKSWKRPFLTIFFMKLMSIGYMVLYILVIMVPQLLFSNYPLTSKSIFIFISILGLILYLHIAVVWVLGIVVSVMEENCFGIEALGKAGRIAKGKRFDGFVLTLGSNLIFLILYGASRLIKVKPGLTNQIIMGLVMIFVVCLVGLFQFVAYTVLYFQCKKNHGEEIGVHGKMEYSKIPTIPLVHEDIL